MRFFVWAFVWCGHGEKIIINIALSHRSILNVSLPIISVKDSSCNKNCFKEVLIYLISLIDFFPLDISVLFPSANFVSSSIHELRRDLQNVLGAKANLNLGPTIENYGGETFLSQEVAINILQETKLAMKRCQVVRRKSFSNIIKYFAEYFDECSVIILSLETFTAISHN